MNADNPTEESHKDRSNYVRTLVQRPTDLAVESSVPEQNPPKKIVQFWNDLDQLPRDVSECIRTWERAEDQGFDRALFDRYQARDFINDNLGTRYKEAYDRCYHPAMQSDYFRLCYIYIEGGCYIDADDIYNGAPIQHLFNDNRLKIQPLCYDITTNSMVPPSTFTKQGANSPGWIFYFNNNPLIAGIANPIIGRALNEATFALESKGSNNYPEIQSTTGPGNLTKSIFDAANECTNIEKSLLVLHDWQNIAKTIWDLSYRNGSRNWRLSNGRGYKE